MRRAAAALSLVAMLAAACANPAGGALEECEPGLEPAGIAVPEAGIQTPDTIALECYRVVRDTRIEVLFAMPAGPECHGVSIVDAVESADAVSIELRVGRVVNPLGGACPETESQWAVQVELNQPIGTRQVLDRSQPAG